MGLPDKKVRIFQLYLIVIELNFFANVSINIELFVENDFLKGLDWIIILSEHSFVDKSIGWVAN